MDSLSSRRTASRAERVRDTSPHRDSGPGYFDDSTRSTTALMSASLAPSFLCWSSSPVLPLSGTPVFSICSSLACISGLPLYFSASDAHDGPFLVVVAVWHLLHFSEAKRSSAGAGR